MKKSIHPDWVNDSETAVTEKSKTETYGFDIQKHITDVCKTRRRADKETQIRMVELACSSDVFIAEKYRAECIYEFEGLVIDILTKQYPHLYFSNQREDVISACHIAIIEALPFYDSNKGAKPSTFLHPRIVHAANQFDADSKQITRYDQNNSKIIKKAIDSIRSRGIRQPSINDIERETGLSLGTIKRTLSMGGIVYLDELPETCDEGLSVNPEHSLLRKESDEFVYTLLDNLLTPNERDYVLYISGIYGKEYTQAEIKDILGLTDTEVGNIGKSAMRKLRTNGSIRELLNPTYKKREYSHETSGISLIPVEACDSLLDDIDSEFSDEDLF